MSSTQASQSSQISQNPQNPAPAVTVAPPHTMNDFDSWLQKPQVVEIQYSTYYKGWLAKMQNFRTGFRGGMMVCMDCVTVHIYHTCDGKIEKHFHNCDYFRPPYRHDFIVQHECLTTNIEYVRDAINRTPPRRQVPQFRDLPELTVWRGYNPNFVVHRRHVSKCFLGTNPEYIIQGNEGLATSIYYRRCDGKYRNLAHQILEMKKEDKKGGGGVTAAEQVDEDSSANEIDPSALTKASTTTTSTSSHQNKSSSAVTITFSTLACRKRKREDDVEV